MCSSIVPLVNEVAEIWSPATRPSPSCAGSVTGSAMRRGAPGAHKMFARRTVSVWPSVRSNSDSEPEGQVEL